MKKIIYSICPFILLVFTQCTTQVVSFYVVDKASINFTSFNFYTHQKTTVPLHVNKTDSLIEQTIAKVLVSKGYERQEPAQMYISFSLSIGETTEFTNQNRYNTNPYRYRSYNSPYPADYYRKDFKEGGLIIEVFNAKDKLIWQGSRSFKSNKKTALKNLLPLLAEEIMETFTPTQD